MMRRRVLAVLSVVGLSACLPLESRPVPNGATLRVYARGDTARGELLAVSAESLWVATRAAGAVGMTGLRLADVHRVVVQRGGGVGASAVRGVAFGIVSGMGMYAACASVSEGCEGIFAFSVAVPTVLALLAGASMSIGRELEIKAPSPEALARFARWPQGMPLNRRSTSPPGLP